MRAQLCTALLCCALPIGFSASTSPVRLERFPSLQIAEESEAPARPEASAELALRFISVFERLRSGDDSALQAARTLARQMCAVANRCEVPKVVEHYGSLTVQDRAKGWDVECRASDLRIQLSDANQAGLEGEKWRQIRLQVEAAIEVLWQESRNLADLGARAQASALRAEYTIARLQQTFSESFTTEIREGLVTRAQSDIVDALIDYAAFDIVRGALSPRSSLARLAQYRGELALAQATYEALARDARTVQDDETEADAYAGMLAIARDRGDEPEGERCLKALASLRVSTVDWPLAHAWSIRLLHSDRAEDALRFLATFQAPDRFDYSPSARAVRRHLAFTLSEAYLRTGNLAKAREQARVAAAIEPKKFDQLFLEGRIRLAEGQPDSVIKLLADPGFLAALDPREEGAVRTLLGESRLELNDPQGAKRELARALELADHASRRVLDHPLLSDDELRRFNLVGEWEGAGLETVSLMVRAHLDSEEAALAALASEEWQSRSLRGSTTEITRLEALQGGGSRREPLSLEDLELWASGFELGLVTWVFGADSGAVVHVRGSETEGISALGEPIDIGRQAIRDAARQLREQAIAGLETRAIAREIRDALLPARLREHIGKPRSDKDRLLLLVHGPLENMPFELLGLTDQDFDEELCLVVLPGLPAAEPGEHAAPEAFRDWSLLGAPIDGRDGEGPPKILLKGAGEELSAIAALHPKAVRTAEFRRRDLEEAILSQRSLHVATHLEVKPGESRSRFPAAGLRLDDGEVASALDIANLGPDLPLVVLSACETGGGRYSDGEGLFGVSRAFLEGGTRNLVVTLWPVEDGAAKEFSIAFHRALGGGAAPSQATRIARKVLRAADRRSSDWAAFRFLGRD